MSYGHGGTFTALLSKDTEPVRASALPLRVAPVPSVMELWANMLPANTDCVPKVAELPICQVTFLAWAPPIRRTWLFGTPPVFPAAVVNAEPTWKIQTPAALPLRVRFPVIPSVVVAL